MRDILSKHADFQSQSTLVEDLVLSRSHMCYFFPKFHCELNAIERVWCHAKNYARKHVNGSITRLRTVVPSSLSTCDKNLISKFFHTCRDYMKAYHEGRSCMNVDQHVKLYKSHRKVTSINS